MGPARFIAFEGIDGAGKSTQARRVARGLGALLTFEPGDTDLGRELRHLLLHHEAVDPSPRAEALLMAADRAEHCERVIRPALAAGTHVVTDRFIGSSMAYQGHGAGIDLVELRQLQGFATSGLQADLTVVVDCDVATSRARLAGGSRDRLELLDDAYFEKVRAGFLALAAEGGPSWVVVDGTAPLEELEAAVDAALASVLSLDLER